jgi:hypothetical protein
VVPLCNQGRDYQNNHADIEIERALLHACALAGMRSKVRLWALTYGFPAESIARLRAAGYRIRDMSHVHPASFSLSPLTFELRMRTPNIRAAIKQNRSKDLPVNPAIAAQLRKLPQTIEYKTHESQMRRDYVCTSIKMLAWNLTEHSNVLVVDADLYLRTDPLPWMSRFRSEIFVAHSEVGERAYRGLNSRLMYLQPDRRIFELLRRAAISGNYVPYTNSEQDVLETFFSAPVLSHGVDSMPMPDSVHTKEPWCVAEPQKPHKIMVCESQTTYDETLPQCAQLSSATGLGPPGAPPPVIPLLRDELAAGDDAHVKSLQCCPEMYLKRARAPPKCRERKLRAAAELPCRD